MDSFSPFILEDYQVAKTGTRFTMTSLELLKNFIKHEKQLALINSKDTVIFVDSTFKLCNSSDIKVSIVATQTLDHQVRPIAFYFSSYEESGDDYSFFFESLVKCYEKYFDNYKFNPKFVMGDFHQGITLAVQKHFTSERLNCLFHLQQSLDRNFKNKRRYP